MVQPLIWLLLLILLTYASITDLREKIILNRVHVIGVIGACILHFFEKDPPWINYLFTGALVLIVLLTITAVTGGKAIGGGDIKIFSMIGFAVGLKSFIDIFIISHILAALFLLGLKLVRFQSILLKSEFPFAPFILFGVIITIFL